MSTPTTAIVKKFLNDPDDVVPESLGASAPPMRTCSPSISRASSCSVGEYRSRGRSPSSRAAARARAVARRVRRGRHARRSVSGGGLHLPGSRPDARRDQGRRQRRRSRPHRQELHGRRPQLPDGRRARRGTRGSRSSPSSPNDDVAVEDSLYTAGRRGTGVTVLVEKIAGAKAEAVAAWPRSRASRAR